jgi:DNA-binding LytR/AlgR family response regulator
MKNPKILEETPPESIQILTADSNYTIIRLTNGQTKMSGYSLNVFELLFDTKNFIRVNRSNLVNRRFISWISKEGQIYLKNDSSLTIPRIRKTLLTDLYPTLFNL